MRDRTRDLEQIRERDADEGARRAGAIVVATLGVVGLTFGLGLVVTRAEEPPQGTAPDPLDRLTASARKIDSDSTNGGVERTELTFPSALTGEEDRPEVLAALRAAALEEEGLAGEAEAPTASTSASLSADIAGARGKDHAAHTLAAAGETASEATPAGGPAQAGTPGEYMLQVLSYDAPEAAQAFARDLRSRGHTAYVTAAEVPERGRTWRVRIGPFDTMRQAEAYRRTFEQAEAVHAFVVRRQDEEP